MKARLLVLLMGMGTLTQAAAESLPAQLTLYSGDVRVLEAPGIERLAVGNVEMISATLLKNQEMVLTAEGEGETTVQAWFTDGHREQMGVVVVKANGYRQIGELRALLSDVPGLKIRTVGRQVVLEGRLHSQDLQRVKDAVKFYDNVLVLAEEQNGAAIKSDSGLMLEEVRAMLGQIPGISIKTVGRQIVVDGDLNQIDMDRIKLLQERYPDMLVLAQPMSQFVAPMIYFDVRITEFAKDDVEELGVNWSTSINGPSFAFSSDQRTNPYFRGQFPSDSGTFDDLNDAVGNTGTNGYWGIATEITSRINFLEKNGSALTLASPRLSARSGGVAELTVGGEVPVVTSSINGPSVEYKEFGIILNISPQIYGSDRVAAKVMAEISQLDKANQVGDYPAFKTRRTDNEVQLKIGETLVLSGLVNKDTQQTYEGVKWLQDIPVLGPFFRNKSFKGGQTELVIFITPELMTGTTATANQHELDRAERMLGDFEKTVKKGLLD
jgi:pilus assembly protein CpaC